MAELETELIERAIRWCADAGRQATPALVEAALRPLSWDELLVARAVLADPPPARPLGPFALADIARGAPADVAAERERGGRYGAAVAEAAPATAGARASAPSPAVRGRKRAQAPFRVRRASDRQAAAEAPPAPLPLFDELLRDEGRAALERRVRRHGGKRARILADLAAGWRRADGAPIGPADLDRALALHGMARSYEVRERDELLHALRAAGGVRARAATDLGLDLAGLDEALERLGAREDAERLRAQRRRELRARGTLTQRAHLLLDETERLADLDLIEEFQQDLQARLPDHLRALAASGREPLIDLLGRSLSLDRDGVERLAQRTGIRIGDGESSAAPVTSPAASRPPSRPQRPGTSGPRSRGDRPPARGRPGGGGRRAPDGRRSPGGPRSADDRRPPGDKGAGRGRPPSGNRAGKGEGRGSVGRPGPRTRPAPRGRPGAGGRPVAGPRPGGNRPPRGR